MELELLDKITGSGLYSATPDEPYFSWQGCDYCAARTGKHLGNTVADCIGYESLEHAKAGVDYYEFRLCHGCLCAIANGEPWPEEMD